MTTVAVFGSSQTEPGSPEWADAEIVGRAFARAGHSVVTGGYGGTMAAVSKGATEAGGVAIGVTAPTLFPGREGANQYLTKLIEAGSLSERIGRMVQMSVGCVALPGSIGTAAELLIAWNTNHILRRNGLPSYPTVAVRGHWAELRATMVEKLSANEQDINWVDSGEQAAAWLIGQIKSFSSSDTDVV